MKWNGIYPIKACGCKGETPVTVVGGMEAQKCHMIYGMEDLATSA